MGEVLAGGWLAGVFTCTTLGLAAGRVLVTAVEECTEWSQVLLHTVYTTPHFFTGQEAAQGHEKEETRKPTDRQRYISCTLFY